MHWAFLEPPEYVLWGVTDLHDTFCISLRCHKCMDRYGQSSLTSRCHASGGAGFCLPPHRVYPDPRISRTLRFNTPVAMHLELWQFSIVFALFTCTIALLLSVEVLYYFASVRLRPKRRSHDAWQEKMRSTSEALRQLDDKRFHAQIVKIEDRIRSDSEFTAEQAAASIRKVFSVREGCSR